MSLKRLSYVAPKSPKGGLKNAKQPISIKNVLRLLHYGGEIRRFRLPKEARESIDVSRTSYPVVTLWRRRLSCSPKYQRRRISDGESNILSEKYANPTVTFWQSIRLQQRQKTNSRRIQAATFSGTRHEKQQSQKLPDKRHSLLQRTIPITPRQATSHTTSKRHHPNTVLRQPTTSAVTVTAIQLEHV